MAYSFFYNMEKNGKHSPEEQLKRVGEALKKLRISKGHSNYDYFAYEIGMSRSQYGEYEKGKNMNLLTLMRILDHHNITIDEFFKEVYE